MGYCWPWLWQGQLFVTLVFYLQKFELLHIPPMGEPIAFFYKGYLFGNLLLFGLGMMVAPIALAYGRRLKNPLVMGLSAAFFLVMVYFIRFPSQVFTYSEIYLVPAFFVSVFFVCLGAVINQPRLPLETFFGLLGKHSYTIYLFHYQFLLGLSYIGLFNPTDHGRSIVVVLLLSPLFLLLCIGIDRAACRLRAWLETRVGYRLQPG